MAAVTTCSDFVDNVYFTIFLQFFAWCLTKCMHVCMHAVTSVVPNSFDPMHYRLLCPWTFQARILEWVAMPSSRGSSQPRDQIHVSCIGRQVLYHQRHLGSPAWQSIGGQFRNIFFMNRIKKNLKGKYNEEVCHSINRAQGLKQIYMQ